MSTSSIYTEVHQNCAGNTPDEKLAPVHVKTFLKLYHGCILDDESSPEDFIIIINCFYIALFSAFKQTHCACM